MIAKIYICKIVTAIWPLNGIILLLVMYISKSEIKYYVLHIVRIFKTLLSVLHLQTEMHINA